MRRILLVLLLVVAVAFVASTANAGCHGGQVFSFGYQPAFVSGFSQPVVLAAPSFVPVSPFFVNSFPHRAFVFNNGFNHHRFGQQFVGFRNTPFRPFVGRVPVFR